MKCPKCDCQKDYKQCRETRGIYLEDGNYIILSQDVEINNQDIHHCMECDQHTLIEGISYLLYDFPQAKINGCGGIINSKNFNIPYFTHHHMTDSEVVEKIKKLLVFL